MLGWGQVQGARLELVLLMQRELLRGAQGELAQKAAARVGPMAPSVLVPVLGVFRKRGRAWPCWEQLEEVVQEPAVVRRLRGPGRVV